MFFLLSKILSVLISPFLWILILWGGSYLKRLKAQRKLFRWLAIICFLVFSNGALFQLTMQWWEKEIIPMSEMNGKASTVVVLGGMSALHEPTGRICFHASVDRLLQALQLYHEDYVDRIVISGGSAEILREEVPEAEYLLPFLLDMGLDKKDLFIEKRSRNTYENALYTRELFEEQQMDKEIILVTSAFHMRRARGCFEKQGFKVSEYTVQFNQNTEPIDFRSVTIPSLGTLLEWEIVFKEWVGIVVYRIKRYL